MFDGLSKREIIAWVICLALAVGLTVFGSAYLVATSFISADVSDALKHPESTKPTPMPLRSPLKGWLVLHQSGMLVKFTQAGADLFA
jgi:hypothetical protein